MTPTAGAPSSRPHTAVVASLTRLYNNLGVIVHEQHRRYDEYYIQRPMPSAVGDGETNYDETVPVSSLRGVGRTASEADAELAQLHEELERGDFVGEEDGGPEQVLDSTHHASLTSARRNLLGVPVAFRHMLFTRPNNQGKLILQSVPKLDRCPPSLNQHRVYHTLNPIPFFPPTHPGFCRKYYR